MDLVWKPEDRGNITMTTIDEHHSFLLILWTIVTLDSINYVVQAKMY